MVYFCLQLSRACIAYKFSGESRKTGQCVSQIEKKIHLAKKDIFLKKKKTNKETLIYIPNLLLQVIELYVYLQNGNDGHKKTFFFI